MIPFTEIAERLKGIRKDRAWLSAASGRKPDSIRVALAPKAPASKRSELLQKALSDAIEREESIQKSSPEPPPAPETPDKITLFIDPIRYRVYEAAALSDSKTTSHWAVQQLDKAADEWARTQQLHTYAADAGDGENLPSLGSVTYPSNTQGKQKR